MFQKFYPSEDIRSTYDIVSNDTTKKDIEE